MSGERLNAIDGLRGIAILLVMGLHYFHTEARNTAAALYPYGDRFAEIPIFKYGMLGVNLFFLVSGFAIALTLERSSTVTEFFARRIIRLWPALVVCALFTFFLKAFIPSPMASVHPSQWIDFLPSLTVTPLLWWKPFFPHIEMIEPVYWTLVVEIRFYLVAGLIFFVTSKTGLAGKLVVFTIANILLRAALQRLIPGSNEFYTSFLYPDFFPWFASGVTFYEVFKGRLSDTRAACYLTLMFAIITRTATFITEPHQGVAFPVAVSGVYFAVFWLIAKKKEVSFLELKPLVLVGLSSYSLYLLHNALGMTVISRIPKDWHVNSQLALLTVAVILVLGMAYASYVFVETPTRRYLTKLLVNSSASTKLSKSGVSV